MSDLQSVFQPNTQAELAQFVTDNAANTKRSLQPIGGGTARCEVNADNVCEVQLDLLNRVIDFPARDMTITVEAGIRIAELNRILTSENQRLPIDIPQAEQALRNNEARLRAILDTAVEGIITIDEHGTIESLNPAAAKMFGYRADEALGRNVNVLMPSPYHEEHDRYLANYRATGERKIIGIGREVMGRRQDGTVFPMDLSVSEVQLGGRRIFTGFVRDLTERRQAEAALHEKEAQLHAADRRLAEIMHGMTEACFALDRKWRFTFVNDCAEPLFHRRRDEMVGHVFWEVFPQLRGTPMEQHYRRAMRERMAVAFEAFSPVSQRWLDIRVFPTADGLAAFVLDIQLRKQAELALHESEARYRTLFTRMNEGFVLCELLRDAAGTPCDFRLLEANPAFERQTGLKTKSVLGRTAREIVPAMESSWAEIFGRVVATGEPAQFEPYDPHTRRWYEVFAFAIGGERFAVFFRNITERRRNEEALRDSEERFRQVVENIDEVFWMSDVAKNKMLFISAGYERIWGQTRASLYASPRRWLAAIHPQDRARVLQAALRKQIRGDYDEEYRIVRPDGTQRWIRDRAFPIRDAAGTVYRIAGVAEDITARRQEEQRRQLQCEVARLLATAETLAVTVPKLLRAVAMAFDWAVGEFWEVTGKPEKLRVVQVWHAPGAKLAAFVKHSQKLAFGLFDGLPGRVLSSRRPEWIPALAEYPEFLRQRAAARAGLRSAVAFPILVNQHALGVMAFLTRGTVEPDAGLGELFASLGSQIGQFMERRRAEEALREAHEFSKQVVDSAAAGIIVCDRAGRFVVWNPFMEQLTGHRASELLGRRADEVLPVLGGAHFRKMFHDALAGAVFEAADISFDFPETGKRGWLAARFAPWRDARRDIVGVIVTVREITERRQLESELLEITDREQRRIGHDLHDGLGQQLTALEMKCFLLQEDLAAADLAPRRETLQEQTRQISRALRECVTVTRSLAHGLAPAAIQSDGLSGALERLARDAHVPGQLECRLVSDGPVTITDPQTAKHLYRIAQEAVNNALKHARMRHLEIQLTRAPDGLRLQIKDDGRGLPKRQKARSGMGLEVMRHRAHVIGAALEIDSQPGRGVTVTCTLPLKES